MLNRDTGYSNVKCMNPASLTAEQKQILVMAALRRIAMSYREMIDTRDTPPQEFADQILAYIGEDLEMDPEGADELPAMFVAFRQWRKENWDSVWEKNLQ